MLGAICGDVIGSYYENHCTKDVNFPFVRDSRFTDDSVLLAAVAQTILDDPREISPFGVRARAREYGARYRQFYARFPDAGFGQMFAAWARDPQAKNGRSYANGAAMRVIPIAYAYPTLEQVLRQTRASCLPTHSHPEAIAAACAVATAVFLARHGATKTEIRAQLARRYRDDLSRPLDEIRRTHVFDPRARYSVPPAIVAFLASTDYESAVRGAVSLGGDADTQACIAGGIAEAFYGGVPAEIVDFCYGKVDPTIRAVVRAFRARFGG